MKKRAVFIILISLLCLIILVNGIYAISTDLKANYQPDETAIVKIAGNIMNSINPEQVNLLKGHNLFPMTYDIKKIGSDYYIWFIAPNQEGNYTLEISNVTTNINGYLKNIDFLENFTVEGNTSDYYISPGFISTFSDFDITVISNLDNIQNIPLNYIKNGQITIKPGENKLHFSIDEVSSTGFYTITIGKYNLPAYLISNSTRDTNSNNSNNSGNVIYQPLILIIPNSINYAALINTNNVYPVVIRNYGGNNLSNISLSYNSSFFTINPNILNIDSNQSTYFNLTIRNINQEINSSISINYFNYSFNLPVFVSITENSSPLDNQTDNSYAGYDCIIALGGNLCSASETCSSSSVSSAQGSCCLGKCIAPGSQSTGGNSWLGWLIGIAILAVLGYVFFRYRKVKGVKNPIQKQVENIEKNEKFKKL